MKCSIHVSKSSRQSWKQELITHQTKHKVFLCASIEIPYFDIKIFVSYFMYVQCAYRPNRGCDCKVIVVLS